MIQVKRTALFRSAFIIICFFLPHKPPVWLSFSFLFVRYFCTFSHFFHFRILIRGIAESKRRKPHFRDLRPLRISLKTAMSFFLNFFQCRHCRYCPFLLYTKTCHCISEPHIFFQFFYAKHLRTFSSFADAV